MPKTKVFIPTSHIKSLAIELLEERGVEVEDIAKIVYDLQKKYNDITMEQCIENVYAVLDKRELLYALLVGIELDKLTEQKKLSEPLQEILEADESLFGIDETLALGSVFGYGSIAITNYGYLDKVKPHIIGNLDTNKHQVHTFLDDLVAAIASGAAARLAHRTRDSLENGHA